VGKTHIKRLVDDEARVNGVPGHPTSLAPATERFVLITYTDLVRGGSHVNTELVRRLAEAAWHAENPGNTKVPVFDAHWLERVAKRHGVRLHACVYGIQGKGSTFGRTGGWG